MRYHRPRGTQDILPAEAARWRHVESTFRRICAVYGYGEIRTPTFEPTELFVRSVGEHTDIVSKEMYEVVPSRAGEEREPLTLRPEGTAPTLRAYVQHSMWKLAPVTKLYYLAAIFRHERPQAGRLREHHQAGIEALGSDDPALDVETIRLGLDYLAALGITGTTLWINSVGCAVCRPLLRQELRDALRERLPRLCADCQRRYEVNPLRILDCKVEDWDALGVTLPDLIACQCADCQRHFGAVRALLDDAAIEYFVQPRLVRGLDYYTRTAFEVTHPALGAQNTLIGGGRYDGLVEELGGPPTPGIGFGSGIERVLLVCEALGIEFPSEATRPVFVITLGEAARRVGLRLLGELRRAGIASETDYTGRSIKAQMRAAHRANARIALILGEEEVAQGAVSWRDLDAATQETLPQQAALRRLGVG